MGQIHVLKFQFALLYKTEQMFSFIFVGHISNIVPFHLNLWDYHMIVRNAVELGCAACSSLFLLDRVLTECKAESERRNCLHVMEKTIWRSQHRKDSDNNLWQKEQFYSRILCRWHIHRYKQRAVPWRKFSHNWETWTVALSPCCNGRKELVGQKSAYWSSTLSLECLPLKEGNLIKNCRIQFPPSNWTENSSRTKATYKCMLRWKDTHTSLLNDLYATGKFAEIASISSRNWVVRPSRSVMLKVKKVTSKLKTQCCRQI